MKKLTLQLVIVLCASSLFAQWIPVNNGLPDFPPTAIVNWVDTMVVSTYGGGIYLTYDQGENWLEMPGSLPNLFVNRIDYRGGQFDPISVSTEGGPFTCVNGGYIDCNGTGLTNTNVNFWSGTGEGWDLVGDAIIGTHGDGIYAAEYTSPLIYDWAPSNAGISGDGLFVNDGVVGETLAWLATEGGVYYANFGDIEWSASNDGLVGDALKINHITYIGALLIATDGGFYYVMEIADTWLPVIANEKFNKIVYITTPVSPSGYMVYALGEKGFYTQDFENWIEMDFGGIDGEITAAAADSENLYLGFTLDNGSEKESGGMYKRPLEELVVGIDDNYTLNDGNVLFQNHPNPCANTTQIVYSLASAAKVCLKVYDAYGREVQTIVNEKQQSGQHQITFDTGAFAEGIYFYTLQTETGYVHAKKMIIKR